MIQVPALLLLIVFLFGLLAGWLFSDMMKAAVEQEKKKEQEEKQKKSQQESVFIPRQRCSHYLCNDPVDANGLCQRHDRWFE